MTQDNAKSATVVHLDSVKKGQNKGGKCSICAKPAHKDYHPFCSKRCADVDLGKWLGDGYRIPTDEVPGFDGDFDGED